MCVRAGSPEVRIFSYLLPFYVDFGVDKQIYSITKQRKYQGVLEICFVVCSFMHIILILLSDDTQTETSRRALTRGVLICYYVRTIILSSRKQLLSCVLLMLFTISSGYAVLMSDHDLRKDHTTTALYILLLLVAYRLYTR